MFVLFEMARDVRIDPSNLEKPRKDAVSDELNRLLSNRVMIDVGLCMTLWDIKSIGIGTSYPGDAGIHCHVVFRYVVFRPFQDEIITGKIKKSSREGVHVTLEFFDDILIPPEGLQHPSRFNEQEQTWIWDYTAETEDGEVQTAEMFMDKGQRVKMRITAEKFSDTTPIPVPPPPQLPTNALPSGSSSASEAASQLKIPYSLTASINEQGLGLTSWWEPTGNAD